MERLSSKDDRSQTRHVIRRNSKGTAVYRTVRTVVWEDGGKPPPTRLYYTQMNLVGVPDYTLIHLDEALLTSAIKSDGDTVGFMLTSKCT